MDYPLLTNRLSIEPLGKRDIEAFVRYRQNPEIARYQSWSPDYSQSQAQELVDSQAGKLLPESGEWLQLAIHLLKTGELIGDLALHSVEGESNCFEIGFTINEMHQGNGYAFEATSKLLAVLTILHGAKRFFASADSRNYASLKLLDNLGFNHDPSRDWEEVFKDELVSVSFFEKRIDQN